MNTYALIETENVIGKVAYVETINETENVLGLLKDNKIKSISIYRTKKEALKQAQQLNEIYKERNTAQ